MQNFVKFDPNVWSLSHSHKKRFVNPKCKRILLAWLAHTIILVSNHLIFYEPHTIAKEAQSLVPKMTAIIDLILYLEGE